MVPIALENSVSKPGFSSNAARWRLKTTSPERIKSSVKCGGSGCSFWTPSRLLTQTLVSTRLATNDGSDEDVLSAREAVDRCLLWTVNIQTFLTNIITEILLLAFKFPRPSILITHPAVITISIHSSAVTTAQRFSLRRRRRFSKARTISSF